jgi:hypothetical protein
MRHCLMPETTDPVPSTAVLPVPTTTASKLRTRKTLTVPEGVDPRVWREEQEAKLKEVRRNALAKAHAVLKLKREAKAVVEKKVELGQPITAEEEKQVRWSQAESTKHKEDRLLNAVSKLVIKPQTVEALRLVVERTAAKHGYNPVESLIQLAAAGTMDPKDEAAIHKALLPFLAPPVPQARAKEEDLDSKKVRVTVTQFVFPGRNAAAPALHTERPTSQIETTTIETAPVP